MEIVLHMERDPISPAWAWDPTIKQNKLLNAVIISFRVLWIKHVKLMILNKIDPDLVNTHTHTHTHRHYQNIARDWQLRHIRLSSI